MININESLFENTGWKEYFKQSKSVLLVIDPQNDVLDEKGNLGFWQVWKHARDNNAIENIRRVILASRKANIPVIWAKQFRLANNRDIFPGTFDGDMLTLIRTMLPEAFLENSWETEIFSKLADLIDPGDIIIGKHGSSMFEGTNLEKHLNVLGARVLLTTGFLTDFCIEATVRSATDKGYLPVTIGDACATQNEELQEAALSRINSIMGPVVETDEIADLIRDHTAQKISLKPRTFVMEEVGKNMAQGLSMNDIVDWKQYVQTDETALLVVDPQNGFLKKMDNIPETGSKVITGGNKAIENIKKLVEQCRMKNIRILWIKHSHLQKRKKLFDNRPDTQLMETIYSAACEKFFAKKPDTEIIDGLSSLIKKEEIVIEKPGWSAFEDTALEKYLSILGIKNLIVCGFPTDLSVESTVRNASDRGYFTIIASDACAAASQKEHEQALFRFDRLIGPLAKTESLVQFLDEL